MTAFAGARRLLLDGIRSRAFPAAVVEAGRRGGVLWREAFGTLTYDEDAPETTESTVFDLASLTKVLATTPLAMRAVERQLLDLEEPIVTRLRDWRGEDRAFVTPRDLLAHCSGLTAYLPFYKDCRGRSDFEAEICRLKLEYVPRSRSIYSDLGFILLGFLLEDAAGAPLDAQFAGVAALVSPEPLAFRPPAAWRGHTAPTEVDPWRGRLLVAEVHDENAWALGGVAAHAGVFGTAAAVGSYARLVLATFEADTPLAATATLRRFVRRTTDIPGSSRALGWDTMMPTSSCGTRMSPEAIGHTGFTGTSLWIDPTRDLYIALLTNRVHPTRENDALQRMRPAIHDAIVEELDTW
jgi:CubicO group peptidase (beta-lactamase class C family)